MNIAAIFLILYIIFCIVGLHVGINYLSSVKEERKFNKEDVLVLFSCIFLNIFAMLLYWHKVKSNAKKVQKTEDDFKQQVLNHKQSISTLIPYFDKKNYTVAALIHSGNPYGYLLGSHLLNNCKKDLSYTLTEEDIYQHASVVLLATPVQIAAAKYEQQDLNKRDLLFK